MQHKRAIIMVIGLAGLGSTTGCMGCMNEWQIEANQRRCQPLVDAVTRYREARGEYPKTLQELTPEYIRSIPPCWYWIFPGRFYYRTDRKEGEPPELRFRSSPISVRYYSFKAKKWLVDGL